MKYFAYWSRIMDTWVVVHEVPGYSTPTYSINCECPSQQAAEAEARRLNLVAACTPLFQKA